MGKSRMDNPEKLTTLGTRDTKHPPPKSQNPQKTKTTSKTDTRKMGVNPCAREGKAV